MPYGDASNIVSLRAGLHATIEELKLGFQLIAAGVAFAASIAALGGIAALNHEFGKGGLFEPVPKKKGQSTAGPGEPENLKTPSSGHAAEKTFVPPGESVIALVDKNGEILTQRWTSGMTSHPRLVSDYKGTLPEGYLGIVILKEGGEIHVTLSPNVGPRRGGLAPPNIVAAIRTKFH
jgi:hypothetical protein